MKRAMLAILAVGIAIGVAVVMLWPGSVPAPPEVAEAEPVGEVEAIEPAEPEPAVRSYVDVVRLAVPDLAEDEPWGVPVELRYARRIVLDQPVYLCSRRDLWIAHPQAPPMPQVLAGAAREQVHVVPEQPSCVHWHPDEEGHWRPMLIVRGEDGWEFVAEDQRRAIGGGRAYQWQRALSWNDRLVVPTDAGVSIFHISAQQIDELHGELPAPPGEELADVQLMLDWRGLLAWIPWGAEGRGSFGAMRFVDGQWIALGPDDGWPRRLVHLVPLRDGSVLHLFKNEVDEVEVGLGVLDPVAVDQQQVAELVEQLSDRDEQMRSAAYQELTRYGPGLWPVLERMMEDQPPAARMRMRQLLQNRIRPTLGGLEPAGRDLRVMARLRDGGVVLYSEAGVRVPGERAEPHVVQPAWISIRPGEAVQLLSPMLSAEVRPGETEIEVFGGLGWQEWIVTDDENGPRRFLGNHLVPMLKENEREFADFVGIDRRGRWLFRSPETEQTLLIDPTLPDPTPRLPVWAIHVPEGEVGWNSEDWPVIKRGGAHALTADGWRPVDETSDPMFTTLDEEQRAVAAPGDVEPPILVDEDGTRYFEGVNGLWVRRPDGTETVWKLPEAAVGTMRPHLLRAGDRLFLFNHPGRMLRIKPTPDADEPFKLEAVFTEKIPDTTVPARVWVDPAGRINIAYAGEHLVILFPEGRVPPRIATLMPEDEE